MALNEHTIAVVDDNAPVRKALARLLSVLLYRVELFASAAEFLNAAPTSRAKCLVVDIDLGDMSGLELVRRLSASGFQCPVVFMTGGKNETVRRQCIELGCVAFLQKPIAEARLNDAIATALGLSLNVA